MIPKASKKTKIITIGATYFNSRYQIVKIFLLRDDPCDSSLNSTFFDIFKGTNIEIRRAPSGIRILLTRKSAASKMDLSNKVICPSSPKESADGIPTIKINIPTNQDDFLLLESFPLAIGATIISSIEKADVKVANKNNNKNAIKKIVPNGIWLNTVGSTLNNNTGPASGAKPKENTAGKIANPAKNATNKLRTTIETADCGKFSFLDK